MKIYIAAPYTRGDVGENVHKVIMAADELVKRGHLPYIPHWTHFWHLISPKPWKFWMKYDEEFINWCDALLRLDGKSDGADLEVGKAKELGKLIYYSVEEIP